MATTQYIGARYVPRHMGEWDVNTQYGALDVVLYTDGNSYTAKCFPPKGTPPTNAQYWALSAQFNQQLAYINNRLDVFANVEKSVAKNVKEYGAVGDGITDDTEAIQTAITENRNIIFPAGRYKITKTIDVPAYTIISGMGYNETLIEKTGNVSDSNGIDAVFNILNISGKDYSQAINIKNISVTSVNNSQYGIYFSYGTGQTIFENVNVTKFINGVYISKGCWLSGFYRCGFYNCENGFVHKGSGTSTELSRTYALDCVNAYDISGLVYSAFNNVTADNCTGLVYKLAYCEIVINGIGFECRECTQGFYINNSNNVIINNLFAIVNDNEMVFMTVNNSNVTVNGGNAAYNDATNSKFIHLATKANVAINNLFGIDKYGEFKTSSDTTNLFKINGVGETNISEYSGDIFKLYNIEKTYGSILNGISGDGLHTQKGNLAYDNIIGPGVFITDLTALYTGCCGEYVLNGDEDTFESTVTEVNEGYLRFNNFNSSEHDGFVIVSEGSVVTNGTVSAQVSFCSYAGKTLSVNTEGFNVGDTIKVVKTTRNDLTAKSKVMGVNVGNSNKRPITPVSGVMYFDTTLKKPIWWNGTKWVDATGTEV